MATSNPARAIDIAPCSPSVDATSSSRERLPFRMQLTMSLASRSNATTSEVARQDRGIASLRKVRSCATLVIRMGKYTSSLKSCP